MPQNDLLKSAEAAGRPLTPDERAEPSGCSTTARDAKDSAAIVDQIDAMRVGGFGTARPLTRSGSATRSPRRSHPADVFGKSIFQVDVPPTWAAEGPDDPGDR